MTHGTRDGTRRGTRHATHERLGEPAAAAAPAAAGAAAPAAAAGAAAADVPLVELDRVRCVLGERVVLRDVELTVPPGHFCGIVGPSGSGKTTLLRAILGTVRPVAGSVRLRSGLRLAYVPQVETVDWSFPVTVAECVLMARTTGRWLPWRSAHERAAVHDVLQRLGIADLAHRHIRALSGGQQQRVFLARALLAEPDLLLLDEPTSGVDVHTRHEILHLLDELHRDGLGIVLTTHDLNGIAAHLPHVVCLNTSVIAAGAPRAVLSADVLERTFGAPMEVLEHAGMPVVLDHHHEIRRRVALRPVRPTGT